MTTTIWLAVGLVLLGFLGYRAGRVWLDTGGRDLQAARRLGWVLMGAIFPDRYWWEARIEQMSDQEKQDLLARSTSALDLSRADGLHCPLCGAEVPCAWTLAADGRPTVAPGPVECPACDFRLDACRHCAHFSSSTSQGWGSLAGGGGVLGSGRCNQYKTYLPVEQATSPDMARRLRERGYEQVRAPMPIVDSFLPPDFCRAFTPERKRLKQGGLRWPDAHRTALLRLLAPPAASPTADSDPFPQDEDQWLL